MTRAQLEALAARVEAANAEYQQAILADVFTALGLYSSVFRLLDVNACLDAAASLVPDGYDWAVTKGFGEPACAAVSPAKSVATVETQAATPALALTAAALRARAMEAGDE